MRFCTELQGLFVPYFKFGCRLVVGGALMLISSAILPGDASAQQSTTYETDANGVTYRVTRNVTHQTVPQTEIQTREEKVMKPRVTTQYQTYQQSYLTPKTQYRWVSRMRGRWNPFVQPYWAQQLEPVTTWENRPATVQVPVTSTDWVEERRTVQVPVTTYRTVPSESISKVAVSVQPNHTPNTFAPASAPMVATRPAPLAGGQRMMSDPPKAGSDWQSQGTLRR